MINGFSTREMIVYERKDNNKRTENEEVVFRFEVVYDNPIMSLVESDSIKCAICLY